MAMNPSITAAVLVGAGIAVLAGLMFSSRPEVAVDKAAPATRPAAEKAIGWDGIVPATQPAVATRPAGIHAFSMKDIDGRQRDLSVLRGKVVLIVNVASKCGYTPQYKGLQKLYEEYKDEGLVIVGVPSNDFRGQEPGTEAQIKEFCTRSYGVTFPLLAKVPVKNGLEQTPLYHYLTQKSRNGVLDAKVSWNFNKFLIGRDGRPIRHYESKVRPEDPELRADIEKAIQEKG